MNRISLPALIALGLALIALDAWITVANAQTAGTITFTAQTTTGNGSVTPVLTWATSPAAASCTASGDWTGTKAASGTQTLAAITKSATYNLTCTWADDRAVLSWTLPTTNSDGTGYTDAKAINVYASQDSNNLASATPIVLPPTATTTTLGPLTPAGIWYFGLRAVNQRDAVSLMTNVVSKVIGTASGSKSVGITVNPVPNPPSNFTVQ